MNFARSILASLIIVMMSMSSWANASMTCMSADSGPAVLAGSDVAENDHAHHAANVHGVEQAGPGVSGGDSVSAFSASEQANFNHSGCPCCGGCLSLCAVASPGSATITGSAIDFSYPPAEVFVIFSTSFHAGPPSPPLFRPPSTKTS